MSFDESVAKWKGEFLEDDSAVGLLRERALELGFIIVGESVERKEQLGSQTFINWTLARNREVRMATEEGRKSVLERMDLKKLFFGVLNRFGGRKR